MEEKENVALDTVPKIFWNAVNTRKNKTAMREKDLGIWQSISWKEYGEKAKYIGLALNSLGLDKGDVVSIASEGIPEWLFTDLGVICVGGISSGVYTTDSSSQVEYLVKLKIAFGLGFLFLCRGSYLKAKYLILVRWNVLKGYYISEKL